MSRSLPQYRAPAKGKRTNYPGPFSKNSPITKLVRDPDTGELREVPMRKSRRPR